MLVNVVMPRRLTDEQRKLLEEFDRSADEQTYARRRGVLRQAEERVPLTCDPLRRVSVTVPRRRAEEARATMIELFPEGFEEVDDAGDDVELAAYTDAAGEERLWHAFGGAAGRPTSRTGGRSGGAASTGR